MKKIIFTITKIIGITIIIIWFFYFVIYGEIKSRKETVRFCKEQCNYDAKNKNWLIDVGWIFNEEGLEPKMETKKTFGEKDLDKCVTYCKQLGDHLKYLRDPGSYQRER